METTPSISTGTSHDTVIPATTALLAVNVSGMTPESPSRPTAIAPTTRPPAARVIECRPLPSAVTASDIMK